MLLYISVSLGLVGVLSMGLLFFEWLASGSSEVSFESGVESPLASGMFSLQFFCLLVLFLVFDLELMVLILVTWALVLHTSVGVVLTATVFIVALLGVLVYEYLMGLTEWS